MLLVMVAVVFAFVGSASASVGHYISVDGLKKRAGIIVKGKVTALKPHFNKKLKKIMTTVELEVQRSYKGALKAGEMVSFTVFGGTMPDNDTSVPGLSGLTMKVSAASTPELDTMVVVFLEDDPKLGFKRVTGMKQGYFTIIDGKVTRDFHGVTLVMPKSEEEQAVKAEAISGPDGTPKVKSTSLIEEKLLDETLNLEAFEALLK